MIKATTNWKYIFNSDGHKSNPPPENLMAIERDRFQKIAEAKGSKSIIIEVGNESTEGTFRYKGETFNKSNVERFINFHKNKLR